jgi:predicted AAA+ superfamily ATPase
MNDRKYTLESSQSYFIFGPRGTGKTSWLKKNYKDAIFFDLLETETLFDLDRVHNNLEKKIPNSYSGPIIIDEIQKLPSLLNEVHRLIEKRKDWNFILTGSSARKLRQAGVNLLAGRALVKNFYPLTFNEVGTDCDLKKTLKYGLLPKAYTEENPEKFLKSYLQIYIDLEVRLEGLTRNIGNFSRFLQAASFSQGQILNISSVASDCGIERRVVTNYFDIIRDLLIAYELPVFTKRAKRELVKHRKFFFFDAGVFQIIRPRGPLDSDSEINGPALETLVLQEIMAINEYYQYEYEIFTWHTKKHQEVDFILYGKRGLIAIEVKASSRLREDDFSGLELFGEDYPIAKKYFIYLGDKKNHNNDISVIPVKDFLLGLKDLL